MKKLLSILLAAALVFTLALPAFAEDEPDPAMPVITRQPEDVRKEKGVEFFLRVDARIPNGDAVGYRWMCNDGDGYVEIGNSHIINETWDTVGTFSCYAEVYNRANPEYSVTSETVLVEVYEPSWFTLFVRKLPSGITNYLLVLGIVLALIADMFMSLFR